MVDLFMKLMKYEYKIVMEMRSKGMKILRPSTLYLWLLAGFYTFSGIDIIPEIIVQPKAFGFIDDLIVIAGAIILTGGDLGGMINAVSGKISSIRISEIKGVHRESKDANIMQRDTNVSDVLRRPDTSVSSDNHRETVMGSTIISNDIPIGDVDANNQDDGFDDQTLAEIDEILRKTNRT